MVFRGFFHLLKLFAIIICDGSDFIFIKWSYYPSWNSQSSSWLKMIRTADFKRKQTGFVQNSKLRLHIEPFAGWLAGPKRTIALPVHGMCSSSDTCSSDPQYFQFTQRSSISNFSWQSELLWGASEVWPYCSLSFIEYNWPHQLLTHIVKHN